MNESFSLIGFFCWRKRLFLFGVHFQHLAMATPSDAPPSSADEKPQNTGFICLFMLVFLAQLLWFFASSVSVRGMWMIELLVSSLIGDLLSFFVGGEFNFRSYVSSGYVNLARHWFLAIFFLLSSVDFLVNIQCCCCCFSISHVEMLLMSFLAFLYATDGE